MLSPECARVALAVRIPSSAQIKMQTGMAVAEPRIYEFLLREKRVQSENRSAAPP